MEFLGHAFTTTWKGLLSNLVVLIGVTIVLAVVETVILLAMGWSPDDPYDALQFEVTSFIAIFVIPVFAFVLLKVYGLFKEGKDYKSLAASYFLLSFLITSFSFSALHFMMDGYGYNIVSGIISVFISAVVVYLWFRVFSEKKNLEKTIILALIAAVAIVLSGNIIDFLVNYHVKNIVPELPGLEIIVVIAEYFMLSIPLIYGLPKKLGNFQKFFAVMFVLQTAILNLDIIFQLAGIATVLQSVIILGVIYLLGTNKNLTR